MIYVGLAKRLVHTRMLEHIKETESARKSGNPHINSAVAKDVIEEGHRLSLDNSGISREVNDARKLDP